MNPAEQFRDAIRAAGLNPPDEIEGDGTLRRFSANGKRGDDSGWYLLHSDGVPAGAFGCWRTGETHTWRAEIGRRLTPAEEAAHREKVEAMRREREAEDAKRKAGARARAAAIWKAAQPVEQHPYLQAKGVKAHGLRADQGALVIPMRDTDGVLHSLQFIGPDGQKLFLSGGRVKDCYYAIGKPNGALCIAEGYATAATIHEATRHAVAVAFNAGNLLPVAKALRSKHPKLPILIFADDDARTAGNPGLTKATEAAQAVDALLVKPDFGPNRPEGASDFNDLVRLRGPQALADAIQASQPTESTRDSDIKPAPAGAELLDTVHAFLARFVAYPSTEAQTAHTLWIAHTHLMDKWESTPRIAFLSPEPGSGKTRALEISETLVPRPVEAINTTPAYLFRKVSDPAGVPTILYDEIDTLFGPKAKDNEEIRGILNAGHRRGAMAGRCVVRGKTVETEELPAYCAVALAGLGNLPDTILSRSVVVRMRRRAPNESIEPYRRRLHAKQGNEIRGKLTKWAEKVADTLGEFPVMPAGIEDRNADVWEALLAVAETAGGDWPDRARKAAVALVASAKADTPSLGVRLLSDLRQIFGQRESMHTEPLLDALHKLDEAPWADMRGKPLDARRLANYLKPYGVASKVIRIGEATARGYTRETLHDAWARYLPVPPSASVTSVTSVTTDEGAVTDVTHVTHLEGDRGEPDPEGDV